MIIKTEISKGGRLALYADGEYIMSIDADIWYSLDYTNGCEIDNDELDALKDLVNARLAYSQALRFLTLRSHSEKELYNKLLKKHSHISARYAIEKCRELGFLDDADFASCYAKELAERKKYGATRIRQELNLKGIDREIIDDVINSLEVDYSVSIIDVIQKKYSNCLNDEKGKRRMIAGLMRLGFSYSDIKSALSDYELPEDSENEY
ncbi:MAG: regulatory protein RecX [Clostridia bacterium]|nr:regulatory protein RecX [Clostridia bacterium]